MPIQILMPALSPTMTEGTLAKWLKVEGDMIDAGDVLCEIETDKATMEVEAVEEGMLAKILVAEGTEGVPVNQAIAILLEEGEDADDLNGVNYTALPTPEAPATNNLGEKPATPAQTEHTEPPRPSKFPKENKRIFASPLAKRLAEQNQIDINSVLGSGPNGRIVKRDIDKVLATGTATTLPAPGISTTAAPAQSITALTSNDPILANMPAFEAIPNSPMRQIIATRLTESARDIPHFNITVDAELDALLMVRKELNDNEGADYKISINDLIIKAVAVALTRHPDCNAAYTNEAILKFKSVDISLAVAVEGGLITPIIRDAGSKGLATISSECRDLVTKARSGKLAPEEFQGGTFTISNLGMFGVKSFNSIINPPQSAILSVGAAEECAVVREGKVTVRTIISLTLAVDHRCIDGATAAALMQEVKKIVEVPVQLML